MPVDLQPLTTPLWIMAAVSVLQALLLIGTAVAGYLAYARVIALVHDLEARQRPLRDKVDAILDDVKSVTARVSHQTERVDQAITGTMDRVDETATRVRDNVHHRVNTAVGVVRGVRAVIMSLLHRESHAQG